MRRTIANGTAGVTVAAVVAVGLGVDDSLVTQVDAGATGIWLQIESTGELVLIDPATGVATNRVQVTEAGTPVKVIDTEAFVGVVERSSGNLVTIDPALGVVSGRAPLALNDVSDVVMAGDAWVVGAAGVARVPLDGTEPDLVELDGPSTSAAASGDGVALVIDDTRVDVSATGQRSGADAPTFGLAVVDVGDQAATVVPPDGEVVLDDGTSTCVLGDVGRQTVWGGSATGPRVVVGAHGADATAHVSLLDDNDCRVYDLTDEAEGPVSFSKPLVVDNVLYVVNTTTGLLHIIDLETDLDHSVEVFRPDEPVEILFHEGSVIAHEPRTARGAVLGPDGVRQLIDKSAGRPLVAASGDSALVVTGAGAAAIEGAEPEPGDEFNGDALIDDPVVLGEGEVADLPDSDDLVANFAYSAARVQVDVDVVFIDESTGNPRSWTWDFGDGSNGSGPSVEHSWSEPGTYQVTLSIDRDGESASRSAFIEVVSADTVLAPVADFSVSESTVAAGESVSFTDTSMGEVLDRRWDFGDGSTGVDPQVSKSWAAEGSYVVTLTVSNDAGADSASVTINVVDSLVTPKAVIEVDDASVEVGEPARLRSVSTGDVSRLAWDLGDGTTATGTEVVHAYAEEGSYEVTLTASNSGGSSTAKVVIDVEATTLAPVARIAALPATIEVDDQVPLASISLNGPDTYEWEFGDGQTSTAQNPTHAWATSGTYTVTLTATNESGTDSESVVVTVVPYLPPPIATFDSPAEIRAGTPTEFVDTSANASSYLWDFGDGGTATTIPAIHTYTLSGTYLVTLVVTNRNGQDTAVDTVAVLPALPVAGFTSSPAAVRVNQSVFFSNTSTGAASYAWDFGDGTSSTLPSPTHPYAAAGAYPVTLTVTNSAGETDQASATVNVDPLPPLLGPITATPTPGVTQSPVTFSVTPAVGSGPITSYTWDFGNGVSATTTTGSTTYTYPTAGAYNVTVVASGPLVGDVATAAAGFAVNNPAAPIVTISVSPASPELNEMATLTAVTGVGSGPISTYAWTFGDGTTDTGASVTKAWSSVNSFTVGLTATGPLGATGTASATVNVVPPPPPVIASASASPNPAFTGQSVDFTATTGGSSGPINSWLWNFGDGTTSTQQNPSHTYAVADTYNVTVTATGPVASDVETFSLTVNTPPPILATPGISPALPQTGQDVTFTAVTGAGTGPISSYEWTFSDGATATGASVTHAFAATGSSSATVVATGGGGSDSAAVNFDVVSVNFVNSPATVGAPVVFTDNSSGGTFDSWLWNFGDGTTSTAQNPSHTYLSAGPYTVTLTVSTTSTTGTASAGRLITVL